MRILLFSVTYMPFRGGAEIAVEEILKRLPNINATVITARLQRKLPITETVNNVTIERVGVGNFLDKYFFPFYALRRATVLHRLRSFEIVQAIMANYAGIAAYFFKRKFPTVPYLLTMQSGDSDWFITMRTWWFFPLYKRVYTHANYIQAISTFLVERARRYGFTGRAVRIPNGVDFEFFSSKLSEQELNLLKKELHIHAEDTVFITTSRLVYKNAIDQLILGFHEWVTKSEMPGKLLILGEGKYQRRLQKLTRNLGENERIIFLGYKHQKELPKYLQISDIFCRPSRSEGMGNSFIEAMAAGVPVIATQVGGIPDFLTHRMTGLFAEKDNPDSIARAMHCYVTDDHLREKVRTNAQSMVQERYDWDTIAVQIQKVYENIVQT